MAIWRNGPGYLVQLLVRWLAFAASARLRLIWPMWRQAAMKVSGKVISSLGTWRRVCCWCGKRAVSSPISVAEISALRSEEHTSELQSLMRISYAVFCLKKKKKYTILSIHKARDNIYVEIDMRVTQVR